MIDFQAPKFQTSELREVWRFLRWAPRVAITAMKLLDKIKSFQFETDFKLTTLDPKKIEAHQQHAEDRI